MGEIPKAKEVNDGEFYNPSTRVFIVYIHHIINNIDEFTTLGLLSSKAALNYIKNCITSLCTSNFMPKFT